MWRSRMRLVWALGLEGVWSYEQWRLRGLRWLRGLGSVTLRVNETERLGKGPGVLWDRGVD